MPADIEVQVREYTESLVSTTSPILLEDIRQGIADQPQLNGIPLLVSSSRRPGLGRGLAVATSIAAVVLLIGVITLLSNPVDDSEPAATVPASTAPQTIPANAAEWPGLTDDIPEGVESGMLATPLGTARWVHLSSDEHTLPGVGDLMIQYQ